MSECDRRHKMNSLNGSNSDDKRPDPKPRKNPHLWQAYLWWDELVEMRKRHNLRIMSIEAGKSNMDAGFEYDIIDDMRLDYFVEHPKSKWPSGLVRQSVQSGTR